MPVLEDEERLKTMEFTRKDRIGGIFSATTHVISGLVRAAPHLAETRDPDAARLRRQRAETAMSQVATTPVRQIEDAMGIDAYEYPRRHRGYLAHSRNGRPASRSTELSRFERAKERLLARLK
jgi:hypothetical protein